MRLCAIAHWAAVASLLALSASVGCGGASDAPVHVLRLASADPAGLEHEPAVAFFARRVVQRSGGRLQIAVDERWARDGNIRETNLLRDVARGAVDLGWAHTRSFDRVGVRSFGALDTPQLVDSKRIQAALIRSPVAARLLADTRAAGVRGLALLAGPLSRLVGIGAPLVDAGDLRGVELGIRGAPVAEQATRAVGVIPRPKSYEGLISLYLDGDNRPSTVRAGYEADLDEAFFDRVGGRCLRRIAACRRLHPVVTLDVVLWPRMTVLVASPERLRALSGRERKWIAQAAADATMRSAALIPSDAGLIRELCAAGVGVAAAASGARARLARAWRPLRARLERRQTTSTIVRAIERLRRTVANTSAPGVPAGCRPRSPAGTGASGVRSTLPNGVYRTQRRGGGPRIATLTLSRGHWRLVLTEPGRSERRGTYAGTPLRTAWADAAGSENYLSIAVDRDGGLRFHVVQARLLPAAQALYANRRWQRIGP